MAIWHNKLHLPGQPWSESNQNCSSPAIVEVPCTQSSTTSLLPSKSNDSSTSKSASALPLPFCPVYAEALSARPFRRPSIVATDDFLRPMRSSSFPCFRRIRRKLGCKNRRCFLLFPTMTTHPQRNKPLMITQLYDANGSVGGAKI